MKHALMVSIEIDWFDWAIGAAWWKEAHILVVGGPIVNLTFKLVPVNNSDNKPRIGFGERK